MKKSIILLALMSLFSAASLFAQEEEPSNDAEVQVMIQEFMKNLNTIANHYPNNFQGIKGSKLPSTNDFELSERYEMTVTLPWTIESYLNASLLGGKLSVVAVFLETESKEEALTAFANVADLVQNTSFDLGSMVYDETGNDDTKTIFWLPFILDDSKKAFDSMVVQVRFYSFPSFDSNLKMTTKYTVVLNIGNQ